MTMLDIQLNKLRRTSLKLIGDAAVKLREDATDVKATLSEIEDWLERLQQMSEEVSISMCNPILFFGDAGSINLCKPLLTDPI